MKGTSFLEVRKCRQFVLSAYIADDLRAEFVSTCVKDWVYLRYHQSSEMANPSAIDHSDPLLHPFLPSPRKREPRPSLILARAREPLRFLLLHVSTQVANQHIWPGSPNRDAGYLDSLKIRTVDHAAPLLSCFSHSRPVFA
ncbi:hypothetical protein AVEN_173146-1 [Araneus ventricosus]|uniref:Uncharacterized protein n=1 Tax=Araneus ventricosus TaxID=182803 RepID=A0A4Y2FJQ7_ARAVE|nr:hypothetical protein AVEN_173146-1 [Araneus ventricosus]